MYDSDKYLKIRDYNNINKDNVLLNWDKIDDKEIDYIGLDVKALDDATFKKYAKKIGVNYEKVKDKGILCDKYLEYDMETGVQTAIRTYTYSIGDTITGEYDNKEVSLQVGAISDVKPYGIENVYYDGGVMVVNLDYCKDIKFSPEYISIQSNNTEAFRKEMQENNIDIGYANYDESVKEQKAMILVIKIFLYGFISVITLIGITNIFNTITSNIELRQKEFAMLKSIGMTKKEFNRMINLETIFYSSKSLLYGITFGLLGTLALYKAFSIKISKSMYIPVKPILISAVAVFILVFIIMKYSINKVNKQNTIETIRNDNI